MRNVFDREYWYNYFDVDLLLKYECKNQFLVCDAASSDALHQTHIISNACKQLLAKNPSLKSAVIPINIGNVIDGVYEGSHWVGLVININKDKSFEALYMDSFGGNINEILDSVLTMKGINKINLSQKQQNNAFDCGPWVVFNLVSIVRTGKLPVNIDDQMILKQRLGLRLLLNEKQDEFNRLNISDCPIENPIFMNSLNSLKNDQLNEPESNDINIISKMINSIISLINNQLDLRNCLIELGNLEEQISYNDRNDPQSKFIRNQYGYIQRNKNKQINKNGIYFEKINQLKIICSDDIVFSGISQIEKHQLGKDLINLKHKLNHLLLIENGSKSSDGYFIHNLIEIANKYYEVKIFRKILQTIENIDNIDFNIKEDRYFIARILTIVGQLLNEYLESLSNNFQENKLFLAFQNLMNIRHLLVHNHLKIKNFTNEENQLSIINDSIINIRHHLEKVITENFQINFEYENSEKLLKSTKILLNYLNYKSKPDRNTESIKSDIDKMVSKSIKVIQRIGSKTKDDSQLVKFNNEYQNLLNQLDSHERLNFPESLSISNKNNLEVYINSTTKKLEINKSEKPNKENPISNDINESIKSDIDKIVSKSIKVIQRIESKTKEEKQLVKLNNEYQNLLNQLDSHERLNFPESLSIFNKNNLEVYKNSTEKKLEINKSEKPKKEKNPISNDIIESIDEILWKSYKILSNTKIDDQEIDKQLASKNKFYRLKLNQLEPTDRKTYPDELNYSNKNIIIKCNEPKVLKKINEFIKEINEEILFLESIENNIELIKIKKDFIIEHIILFIGQNVRDLIDLGLCNHKSLNFPDEKWFIGRCISSEILSEAGRSVRLTRNKGLAHNIWSMDSFKLWKTIINDLLPANNYLDKLSTIYENEKLPLSVYSFYALGIAFTDIGLYKRAIEYLEKALDKLEISPNKDATNDYVIVCGMDQFQFQIKMNLAHVYRLIGQYKMVEKILDLLIVRINYQEAILCKNETIRREVSHVYVDLCYLHVLYFNYKKVIELCEQAKFISDNFEIQFYLTIALWEDGQIKRAFEELEKNKENNDTIKFVMFIQTLAFMCLDKLENREYFNVAVKCVEKMEMLMENDIKYYKENNPHGYLLEKLVISYIKCKILLAEGIQKLSINIDSLKDIIKMSTETISKLNADLKRDRIISYIYIYCCKGYLCYFLLNEKKYYVISDAQKYFDLAVEGSDNLIERLSDVDRLVIETAEKLSDSYLMCNEDIDSNLKINYLEKSLALQEKYNLNKFASYHCLSRIFFNLGIDFYLKYMDCKDRGSFDEALINFKKSITFSKLKQVEPITENALKVIVMKDNVTGQISEYVNIETTKFLAMSYNRIGILIYDIFLMKKSIKYYNKLLKMNLSREAKNFYENQKVKSEKRITSVKSTLEFLINSTRELFVTDYSLEFLCSKFPDYVNEENCQMLFEKTNQSLLDNLSPFIKQELIKFSDEIFILYKFYKLLLKFGWIQKFSKIK